MKGNDKMKERDKKRKKKVEEAALEQGLFDNGEGGDGRCCSRAQTTCLKQAVERNRMGVNISL